jgi:hypothetical protein
MLKDIVARRQEEEKHDTEAFVEVPPSSHHGDTIGTPL